MKSPRTRRAKKTSADEARTPTGASHATRNRRGVARGESMRRREDALGLTQAALRAREALTQTPADVERLMRQMREMNESLVVAAVRAHDLSDEAQMQAAQARTQLDDLMSQLRAANRRLAVVAEHAHRMAAEAIEREEEYRRLSARLLTLQDEERRRLALDLHDSTSQRLAALTMNLDVVGQAAETIGARARRALAESRTLAEQCAQEVRTFAYLLHPPLLDEMGLLSAVRWYAEGFEKRSGIHVVLDLGEVGRLPGPIETALFRVVQEGLTNIHRHAAATTASIRLTATAGAVALQIHDQGHGLRDPLTRQNGTLLPEALGVGIQGMRERIRQLGGAFDVEFTDKGTTVCVSVPLKADTP
jgi:signal transduction histidine kinase